MTNKDVEDDEKEKCFESLVWKKTSKACSFLGMQSVPFHKNDEI